MKAYVLRELSGINSLRFEEWADPPKPNPTEVLIRVNAVSLNFRDLMTVEGVYNPNQPLPLIPCSDGVGEVVARRPEGDSLILAFSRPPAVSDLLVPRGSVAVNGVSLTVSDLQPECFEVALIPHTLDVTDLDGLVPGSRMAAPAD